MKRNIFGKEVEISRSMVIAGVVLFISLITVIGVVITKNSGGVTIIKRADGEMSSTANAVETKKASGNEEGESIKNNEAEKKVPLQLDGQNEIKVHIVGCVNKPGVITLKKGQIIEDAIKLAGGVTKEADLDNINLVYKLEENVKIYIRKKGENKNPSEAIQKDSGGVVEEEAPKTKTAANNASESHMVNLNTASKEELMTLPGVGESTAAKIISYRQQNGKFQSIEDIKNVSGIGDSKFNKLKGSITVK